MIEMPRALFFYGVLLPSLASGRMGELVALLGGGFARYLAETGLPPLPG